MLLQVLFTLFLFRHRVNSDIIFNEQAQNSSIAWYQIAVFLSALPYLGYENLIMRRVIVSCSSMRYAKQSFCYGLFRSYITTVNIY